MPSAPGIVKVARNSSAASSFFLPLDRVERGLRNLQKGEPVTRGTLQTTFRSEPFDELRRLGLTDASERAVRKQFPEQTGMLTVAQLIPESAAAAVLAPGDIVISGGGFYAGTRRSVAASGRWKVNKNINLPRNKRPIAIIGAGACPAGGGHGSCHASAIIAKAAHEVRRARR